MNYLACRFSICGFLRLCLSLVFLEFNFGVGGFAVSVPQPGDGLERLVSEMTDYVSSGTLNSTNSTQLI